ncbi:MAG TPA: 3'-5' exonuclease [Bacteroidales bacterium]|nr:3'-5' exonuclease [Bacteroidales bacterium]HPF03160.1 3'-5' exonuclease [Bacteroidales bacterium]HPJ59478.1 3'-5' exonuclease [Bacteroidales bacterium]HPR12861.1 3'-5' exonuclease [Bacteroidales bacterium]HRW85112.1 3'-5' exonuclease [Bacteroidales bacterium]
MKNQFKESLTTDELKEYDLSWFRGEIMVVDDLQKFNRVLPLINKEKVLGFDTETRPSFRKGHRNKVSLIQLASNNHAFLFRINKIGLPDGLTKILADPGILKAGVAINDDIRVLGRIRRFEPAGFVDLQKYVRDFGIQSSGLKKLSAIVLGFRISKRQQVTDWEAEELTEAQQVYAATDAWVCREIYKKLTSIN